MSGAAMRSRRRSRACSAGAGRFIKAVSRPRLSRSSKLPGRSSNQATSCAAKSDSRPWGRSFSSTLRSPTDQADAVFFGPDTYRFVRALSQSLRGFAAPARCRIVDIGCGSGAGGLAAAALLASREPRLVLADISQRALRFSHINAAINGIDAVGTVESDVLSGVAGPADVIIANPPYLVDPLGRLYRHGGGDFGFDLSLRIIEEGIGRLTPGGRLFVYTGTAVVDGKQMLGEALYARLAGRACALTFEEIDPDVFGEELEDPPYDRADRIAAVAITVDAER